MGKLSQQLQEAEAQQILSRTERVKQRQSVERFEKEKKSFEERKEQAEEVRKKEFSEVQSVQDYEKKYHALSPNIKEFFLSPTEVKQEQTERIETTKSTIQEKLSNASQKLKDAKEKHDKDLKSNQEWFLRKKGDERKKARENYSQNEDEINDDYDEARAKWQGYKEGLSKGLGELKSNKDISIKDIDNYAWNVADYEENKQRARNEGSRFRQKQEAKIEDLKEAGYKPQIIEKSFKGSPESTELTFYHPRTKDWKKIAEFKTKGSYDISGLKKLGYSAPQTRTLSFAGKKYKFKSRVPLFVEPGKDIVTPYGKTGFNEAVLLKESQKAYDTEQKIKAKEYLKEAKSTEEKAREPIVTEDKNLWQKIWGGIKTGYTATTFGRDVKMPEEYDIKRKTGLSKYLQLLTFGEASEGLAYEERKSKAQKKQLKQIAEYEKAVKEAPEDLKYYVQEEGLNILGSKTKGEEFYLTPVITKEGISFKSNALIESKSFIEREMVKIYEKAPTIKVTKEIPTVDFRMINQGTTIDVKSLGYDPYRIQKEAKIETVEKKKMTLERGLLYTSYASQKALETYGIAKLIGGTLSIGAKAVKSTYTALGGGLKLAGAKEVTIKGGLVSGIFWKPKVYSTIGKTVLFTGIGGVYTYSKIKSYTQITDQYGEAGKGLFWSGTIGELAGIGALVGEGFVAKYQAKKFNEQQLRVNYLKTQKAKELKLIKAQVNILGKGTKGYKEVGFGKSLTLKQQRQLGDVYAKATGLSKKQSLKIVREKALYEQTLKIKSTAPSLERQIKYIKTGKVAIGKGELTLKRYGISETLKTPKGAKTLAIEFDKKGTALSRIGVKTTVATDKYAVTKVFEQARFSPKLDMKGFRLKKVISTKAFNIKHAKIGDVKVEAFEIDNRLLRQLSKKEFLKQSRRSLTTIKTQTKDIDTELLRKLYKVSGKEARISYFKNVRLQAQAYNRMGIGRKGEFVFLQTGTGKGDLPTLIGKIKYQALKHKIFELPKTRIPKGTPFKVTFEDDILKDRIKDVAKESGKQQLIHLKDLKIDPQTLSKSASQSVIQTDINTKVILKSLIKDKSAQALSSIPITIGALSLKQKEIQKTKLKQLLKSDLQLKSKVLSKLDVSLKSDLLLGTKTLQQTKTIQKLTQLPITTPSLKGLGISITTPIIAQPTYLPPVIPLFFLKGKLRKKLKKKEDKFSEFAYLPDFTAKAIGLNPDVISGKQAQTRIKKILTGLEVRRAVRIK